MEVEVSGKHIKLRFVLFILAFVVGVVAFGIGFYHLTNRETGYYEVKATNDETAPTYANGYSFYCYIDGSSNEIKTNLTKINSLYSESLGRISRLLDPLETYDGYVNLATLNGHIGEDVALPAELYEILSDAAARCEGTEISIFDGALRALWTEALYLEEPEAFDPIRDAFQRERMQAARDAARKPGAVRLVFVDASTHTVRLEVSDAYRATMNKYEIEAPVLDLGLLREAYTLRYVYHKLADNGMTQGYFMTVDGLTVMLPDTESAQIVVYGYENDRLTPAAGFTIGGGNACCVLRSFSNGDNGYYTIDGILRHPYPGPDEEPNRWILTAWSVSSAGDIVGTALSALSLYAAPYEKAEQTVSELASKQISAAYIAVDAPKTVVVDSLHKTDTVVSAENGYELITVD